MAFAAESQRGFGGDAKPCLGTPAVLALLVISVRGGKDRNSFDKAASLELSLPTWQREAFRRAGLGCPREKPGLRFLRCLDPAASHNKSKSSAEPEGSRAPGSSLCAVPSLPPRAVSTQSEPGRFGVVLGFLGCLGIAHGWSAFRVIVLDLFSLSSSSFQRAYNEIPGQILEAFINYGVR